MQQILRALDGAGDELRIKHNVDGKQVRLAFGFLAPAIDLDGVAERLKRVEGKADGQQDSEVGDWIVEPEHRRDAAEIIVQEIEVLESGEDACIRTDAHQQIQAPASARRVFDEDTGAVIDGNGKGQNENVYGLETHVEVAACREQPPGAVT